MKKIIYTAIIGNYDTLKEPKVVTPGWEYICFTNNPSVRSDIWKIIGLIIPEGSDPTETARMIKVDFSSSLKIEENDISVWIDGSIQICCDLDWFFKHYITNQFSEMAILHHNERNNEILEAQACVDYNKVDADLVKLQLRTYHNDGYRFDSGLVSSGLIMRKNTKIIRELCDIWKAQILQFTKRDQISFGYALWRRPVPINYLPYNILHNEKIFKLHPHNKRYNG